MRKTLRAFAQAYDGVDPAVSEQEIAEALRYARTQARAEFQRNNSAPSIDRLPG